MFNSEIMDVINKSSLRDVILLGAVTKGAGAQEFGLSEDGPVLLEFEEQDLCMRQVRGEEEIEIFFCTEKNRPSIANDDFDDAVFSAFEFFCYRRTLEDIKFPTIDRIETFHSGDSVNPAGVIFHLSTGASFGAEASFPEGLKYFFHGQTDIFREEYLAHMDAPDINTWSRSGTEIKTVN